MSENQNQPKEFDAVLGGETPPPISGVVLGGIEGVKSRLKSSDFDVKVAALEDVINYGDAGLDLVIEALNDSSTQVQTFIGKILKDKGGEKGKQALLDFDPWLFFRKLEDWTREDFNSEIGINNPQGKAYIVKMESLKQILQESQIVEIEALICQIDGYYNNYDGVFYEFVNAISDASDKLPNLKALFIGDAQIYPFMSSYLELGNITPILRAFPQLQVIHIRGGWGINIEKNQHKNLKSLVIETGFTSTAYSIIDNISDLDFPALEYLELWLSGGDRKCKSDVVTGNILTLISGQLFPNLKYLGLRSSDYSDNIALCLAECPSIIERLFVLDLSMGTLTDKGVEVLLNFAPINQLHTLNISGNYLSDTMTQKLSTLSCRVINNQVVPSLDDEDDDEGYSYENYRYLSLYE